MKIKKKPLVSVIVINYNNSKYIFKSLNSIINQDYQNLEIVFVDDQSTDDSLKVVRKQNFKKLKIFKTKNKKTYSSFNQLNAIIFGFRKSKGSIIFLIDSDDFFSLKKISHLVKFYENNSNYKMVLDKPIIYTNSKKFKKFKINSRSKYLIPWPKFSPQSCLSFRRQYLKEVLKKINVRKYPNIWFDFRAVVQCLIDFKKIKIINKHLTFYRQSSTSISSKFQKFSKNWWKRRKEAHEYYEYACKINNSRKITSIDKFLTGIVNFVLYER